MRYLVWECDWSDDTNQLDNWWVVGGSFSNLEDARRFVTNHVGDGLGGEWLNETTYVCFCRDADRMGTWAIQPTSVPTRNVNQHLWSY